MELVEQTAPPSLVYKVKAISDSMKARVVLVHDKEWTAANTDLTQARATTGSQFPGKELEPSCKQPEFRHKYLIYKRL